MPPDLVSETASTASETASTASETPSTASETASTVTLLYSFHIISSCVYNKKVSYVIYSRSC